MNTHHVKHSPKPKKKKLGKGANYFLLFFLAFFAGGLVAPFFMSMHLEYPSAFMATREEIRDILGTKLQNLEFPEQIKLKSSQANINVHYTLDSEGQFYAADLLNTWKPDYGAMVVMDADTGRLLVMQSYARENKGIGNLIFRSTFPSASVFKVVTASAAMDTNKIGPESVISFNGAPHTLYRRNVTDTKDNRWTRHMTVKEAFAKSVNTVFAKLGVFYVGSNLLRTYADKFQFNKILESDFSTHAAHTKIIENSAWDLAEVASGFTLESTMSPLQGTLIAGAFATDGNIMKPYLVDSLIDEDGRYLYKALPDPLGTGIITNESAQKMRMLMAETVHSGTSAKAFRKLYRRGRLNNIEVGGKTGSLTGIDPKGKVDWFVGYYRSQNRRLAFSVLTVNEAFWRVKSSQLAADLIDRWLLTQDNPLRAVASKKISAKVR